jgi:hypothetical protein
MAEAQILDSYVRSIGGAPHNRVSYWPSDNPICIRVSGQPPETADYIKARIRYDGLMTEAPMDRRKCSAIKLQIVFTDHFDIFVQDLANTKPDAFEYKRQSVSWNDLATIKGPIHACYRKYDNDDDMIADVLVVVDTQKIQDIKPAALADYLAFISFTEVKTSKYIPAAPTILNLISGRGIGGAEPAELSNWDQLYLKSIYDVGIGGNEFTTNARVEERMRYLALQRPRTPEPPALLTPSKVAATSE